MAETEFQAMREEESFICPKCRTQLTKHKFFFNGCRRHVESYSTLGRTCNEKDCEINHKCV